MLTNCFFFLQYSDFFLCFVEKNTIFFGGFLMKIKAIILSLLLALVLVGCTTVQPVQGNTVLATDDFEVLGRVTKECPLGEAGFTVLLEEAQRLYPEADDIINIIVDSKVTNYFFTKQGSYIMSAVVIKYVN